jgi:hypothetical protein
MDNINPGSGERTANKKVKLLLLGGTSPMIYGATTLKAKERHSASSLLLKTILVVGAVLILTNITLTILASLKVFENLISH